MLKSLSISTKFYGFGVLIGAVSLAIGVVGYWGNSSQATALENVTATAKALGNHMDADMMHDALRADVLSALRASHSDNPNDLGAVAKDLGDHATRLRDDIAANQKIPLSDEVTAALTGVGPKLDAYVASAEKMLADAKLDPTGTETEYGTFLLSFEDLEGAMEKVSDLITASAEKAKEDATGIAGLASILMNSTIGVALAGLAISVWLMARALCNPLNAMTGAMSTLAGGDTNVVIPARERGDEIGRMAAAMQVFKDNAIHAKELAASQAAEQEAKTRRGAALEARAAAFDTSISEALKSVAAATHEMHASAESLHRTAESTNQRAGAVSAASTETTANVQTVASATEELSSSITEISRQVSQSTAVATRAVEEAERTNDQVKGLAATAEQIGDVVKLISTIAQQTHLLALNATIEAARAGEAGRGFAVVAGEVKNLASQTASATEEIGTQVSAIQEATGAAVSAIQSIGATINEISAISTGIASAVEEQGAATREIARSIQQAAVGTQQVAHNIDGVSQAAGETGAAATQMLGATSELASQSERLRTEIDSFLQDVKNA